MSTRLVFLKDGSPVSGVKIKRDGVEQEFTADDDGQLVMPLQEGNQKLVVYHKGSWLPHVVRVDQHSSLLLVDMKDVGRSEKKRERDRERSKQDNVNFLDVGKLDLGERYLYERTLGRGGMGYVIRARDRLLNRSVAIKLLSEELQDNPEAQKIFLSEARHLATLSHPNLVAVHDIGKLEERVFMVIEYVKGETLEHLVANLGTLPQSVALKIAIQLTRVVAYLHDQGIIHRDLKLANAMVRHDGTLKLVDFGLARQFDELYIRGTRVRGTPAYMSPEQITGSNLTPSSDIYQLGVCLFELLTGRLPFEKGEMSYAHVHETAPDVRTLREDVHQDLALLINSCLAKHVSDRPRDAHEVLDVLQYVHHQIEDVSLDTSPAEHAPSARGDSLMRLRLRTSEMNLESDSFHTPFDGGEGEVPALAVIRPARSTYRHTPVPETASSESSADQVLDDDAQDDEFVVMQTTSSFRLPWVALIVLILVCGGLGYVVLTNQDTTPPELSDARPVSTPPTTEPPVEGALVEEVIEPPRDPLVADTAPELIEEAQAMPAVAEPAERAPVEAPPRVAPPVREVVRRAPVKKAPVRKTPAAKTSEPDTSVSGSVAVVPVVTEPAPRPKPRPKKEAEGKKEGLFDISAPAKKQADDKIETRKTLLPM